MNIIFGLNSSKRGLRFLAVLLALSGVGRLMSDAAPTAAVDVEHVTTGQLVSGQSYTANTGSGDKTISFTGVVTFNNEVTFAAEAGRTLTINVQDSGNPNAPTVFKTLLATAANPSRMTNLVFNPSTGSQIIVNVYTDLFFTGSNVNNSFLATGDDELDYTNTPMVLTFKGAGTTVFNIIDGKSVNFTSLIEEPTTPNGSVSLVETLPPALLGDRIPVGTHMYVAMDQIRSDVAGRGLNKIVVQRQAASNLSFNDSDIEFQIGLNSFLTFVSKNYTGLDESSDPSHAGASIGNSGGIYNLESYAGIAFDVSNRGKGRMFFTIKGDPDVYNSYTDGAFNLAGYYLQDRLDPLTAIPGTYLNNEIRNYVNFGQRAGSKAFLRVNDNQSYFFDKFNDVGDTVTYINDLNPAGDGVVGVNSAGKHSRRGLIIKCSNKSIAALASNPYGDGGWHNEEISDSGRGSYRVQPGFVVGVNGHIEVSHNTFVEYEAQSHNINFEPANIGLTTLNSLVTGAGISNPNAIFKKRNPSALLFDGLGSVIESSIEQIKFLAHVDATISRRAEITLYGNASINYRAPLIDNISTVYDGFRLTAPGETLGEGVFVVDVEGPVLTRSFPDTYDIQDYVEGGGGFKYGLHDPSGYAHAAGVVRIGSLWRSYDDREILNGSELLSSYIKRPLLTKAMNNSINSINAEVGYKRYDRASILLNDDFDFDRVNYHHEDVSREILPNTLLSDPVFYGGERAFFLNSVFDIANPDLPFMRLYNTNFHCHESMCLTGVRIVMRELPDVLSTTAAPEQNLSSIIMYNHGDDLDNNLKNYGRVFLMGSLLNKTSNGTASPFMQSCNFNIFRSTGGDIQTGANPFNLPVKLSLKTASEIPTGASLSEKALQLFYLGNQSNVEVGWVSEVGIYRDNGDVTVFPWDHRAASTVTSNSNKFTLDTAFEVPATLSFAGDYIYLGGFGPNGEPSPSLVSGFDLGRVIYMGHGSKIEVIQDTTDPLNPKPYIAFSDATIAIRLWKSSVPGLNTQLDLPFDQMILKNPIRPYDIDMNIITDANDNPHLRLASLTGSGIGTVVGVAWNLINKSVSDYVPLSTRAFNNPFDGIFKDVRSIIRVTTPVHMPTRGLLQMSTGDYLDQLQISGASISDPLTLYLTGDADGIAQVRELVSVDSPVLVPGEGNFGKIFMDNGARVGLGTRNWNEHSVKAWNLLGKNFVTIIPNGDCQVEVNSNLLVADANPIVPTTNFGSEYVLSGDTISPIHRVTFFSNDSREIRIAKGKELDLSAFGQATNGAFSSQQIAFAGKVRLIFEPGSALRFPSITDATEAPILYMNEESELIFEALTDMENKFKGNLNLSERWETVQDTERAKIKIKGTGQIWINKSSKMKINDGALVCVESDTLTPKTDITISVQRQGVVEIGDQNLQGGSLQIGNPYFNAVGSPLVIPGAEINFTLRIDSPDCIFNIGRNGFLGFGVGVVDRFQDLINSWKVQRLQDVNKIHLKLIEGVFSHNQIFDGTNREASLMAIGPVETNGSYKIEIGSSGIIRGGGNIIFIDDTAPASATDVFANINITNQAVPLNGTSDNGKYSILTAAPILKEINRSGFAGRNAALNGYLNPNSTANLNFVLSTTSPIPSDAVAFSESGFDSPASASAYSTGFVGGSKDCFRYLSFWNFGLQNDARYVCLSNSSNDIRVGYTYADITLTNGIADDTTILNTTQTINRDVLENLSLQPGLSNANVALVKTGVLAAATINLDRTPGSLRI